MCFFCEGNLEAGKMDYIKNKSTHVVMIRDVPCEKCDQCGETYLDDKTMAELEEKLAKVKFIVDEAALTIINYVAVA